MKAGNMSSDQAMSDEASAQLQAQPLNNWSKVTTSSDGAADANKNPGNVNEQTVVRE